MNTWYIFTVPGTRTTWSGYLVPGTRYLRHSI